MVNTQLTILWMCTLMSSHIVMYNSNRLFKFLLSRRSGRFFVVITFFFFLLFCCTFLLILTSNSFFLFFSHKGTRADIKTSKFPPKQCFDVAPAVVSADTGARNSAVACCVHISRASLGFQFLTAPEYTAPGTNLKKTLKKKRIKGHKKGPFLSLLFKLPINISLLFADEVKTHKDSFQTVEILSRVIENGLEIGKKRNVVSAPWTESKIFTDCSSDKQLP